MLEGKLKGSTQRQYHSCRAEAARMLSSLPGQALNVQRH